MNARIHEMKELRNRHYVFRDRSHAGKVLSVMLKPEYGEEEDVIILAIPSGGVPVAREVSENFDWPMDMVIVRKLQIPGNPEAGFGAMTREGTVLLNEEMLTGLRLSASVVEKEKQKVRRELEKRNELFREGRPFPSLEGISVILIDDGLASGYTMMASIHEVKKRKPGRAVVAVPTAPLGSIRRIESLVDDIYCPNIREGPFFSVAGAYENWYDLDHADVMILIRGQNPKQSKGI
jgi:putative phosphoribosyl transferase